MIPRRWLVWVKVLIHEDLYDDQLTPDELGCADAMVAEGKLAVRVGEFSGRRIFSRAP